MYTKEHKLSAIANFLLEGWDENAPLDYRINYMINKAKIYCHGFPEWSDIYGNKLQPLDNVSLIEFKELINEIEEYIK